MRSMPRSTCNWRCASKILRAWTAFPCAWRSTPARWICATAISSARRSIAWRGSSPWDTAIRSCSRTPPQISPASSCARASRYAISGCIDSKISLSANGSIKRSFRASTASSRRYARSTATGVTFPSRRRALSAAMRSAPSSRGGSHRRGSSASSARAASARRASRCNSARASYPSIPTVSGSSNSGRSATRRS